MHRGRSAQVRAGGVGPVEGDVAAHELCAERRREIRERRGVEQVPRSAGQEPVVGKGQRGRSDSPVARPALIAHRAVETQAVPDFVEHDRHEVEARAGVPVDAEIPVEDRVEVGDDFLAGVQVDPRAGVREGHRVVRVGDRGIAEVPQDDRRARGAEHIGRQVGPPGSRDANRHRRVDQRGPDIDGELKGRLRLGREAAIADDERIRARPIAGARAVLIADEAVRQADVRRPGVAAGAFFDGRHRQRLRGLRGDTGRPRLEHGGDDGQRGGGGDSAEPRDARVTRSRQVRHAASGRSIGRRFTQADSAIGMPVAGRTMSAGTRPSGLVQCPLRKCRSLPEILSSR